MRVDYPLEFQWIRPSGFIIYQPDKGKASDAVLYDRHSWEILNYPAAEPHHEELPSADIPSLCKKWKEMLEQSIEQAKETTGNPPDSLFIDLFMSGRRRYRVKGFRLYSLKGPAELKMAYFMFTLERIHRDSVNLPQIFREAKLSKREQDIIHEILADKCNKEIADALGLSLNTVKVYLKYLMRKLNVTSRAGIVSFLLLKPSAKR